MNDSKYTDKEIKWAIGELKKKHPEKANKDQAIKLLDTMRGFANIVVGKVEKDRRSGKLKYKIN